MPHADVPQVPPSPGTPLFLTSLLAAALLTTGCGTNPVVHADNLPRPEPSPAAPSSTPVIRATGTIQAVRAFGVQVPQITGQNSRITLVKIVANGTLVKEGDILAEFDRTLQLDAAREAESKFDDLSHQVRQKAAQNGSDAEKRAAETKQAEADLAKAEIQLKKGPVLSEVDRHKNEAKAEGARARVASLTRVHDLRLRAEAAALRVLELQRDRQKVALERAQSNAAKLVLKAPIAGMVALENLWRSGSMGQAQEGDQLWTGQPLMKIFDPGQMEVRTMIGEPDGVALHEGTIAAVHLDAYPDANFRARFQSASPVATAALGSPIKNFTARFRIEGTDPRLLPDLSAAVVIEVARPGGLCCDTGHRPVSPHPTSPAQTP